MTAECIQQVDDAEGVLEDQMARLLSEARDNHTIRVTTLNATHAEAIKAAAEAALAAELAAVEAKDLELREQFAKDKEHYMNETETAHDKEIIEELAKQKDIMEADHKAQLDNQAKEHAEEITALTTKFVE